MRLALVYDAVYPWVRGGGEAHNDELARRLVARGHEVHLVGMRWWPGPARIEREGVVLHGVSPAMALYQGQGRRRVAPPVAFGLAASAFLARHRFDLVDVCAFPYFAALGVRGIAALRPLAWNVTWFEVWGTYWRQYLGRLGVVGEQVERVVAQACPFNVAHSPMTAARLRALVPGVQVEMIPSGTEVLAPSPLPRRVAGRIGWCGRAVDFKNLGLLLDALALLPAALPWSLEVVADGPALESWKAHAHVRGLSGRVRWHGFLPTRGELHQLLSTCELFVQTSLREGMGKTSIEAAGLGCALVCVEHPDVATTGFLRDGRSALVVPAGQPAAMAAVLARALEDGGLRERLASGGREVAHQVSWERIVERVEAHYGRVVAAGPAPATQRRARTTAGGAE